jgi:hypothetical protein
MVNISLDSSNTVCPVSPGAKEMSNSRTVFEITVRNSLRARFLPMPIFERRRKDRFFSHVTREAEEKDKYKREFLTGESSHGEWTECLLVEY